MRRVRPDTDAVGLMRRGVFSMVGFPGGVEAHRGERVPALTPLSLAVEGRRAGFLLRRVASCVIEILGEPEGRMPL